MYTGKQLGEAIDSARKLKGMSKKALADHFGVRPPSVQDWVNKGTIDKEKLSELWKLFSDVVGPEHWGIGEPDRGLGWGSWGGQDDNAQVSPAPIIRVAEDDPNADFTIPAYRSDESSYPSDLPIGSGQIRSITVTRAWLRSMTHDVTDLSNLRIVTGFSRAMKSTFQPGDPLLVDIGVNHVDGEGVYLFRLNGELAIKIIQRVPVHNQQAHRLRIVSTNPDFLPIEVAASEVGLEILARVLTAWRSEHL